MRLPSSPPTVFVLALALAGAACSSSVSDVATPGGDDTGHADVSTTDSTATRDDGLDGSTRDTTVSDGTSSDGTVGDAVVVDVGGTETRTDAETDDGGPFADSGAGGCDAGACGGGFDCCGGACKNLKNDPLNCGACGKRCSPDDDKSMCLDGVCTKPICGVACASGEQCCLVQTAGPIGPPKCYAGLTCPAGCPLCK